MGDSQTTLLYNALVSQCEPTHHNFSRMWPFPAEACGLVCNRTYPLPVCHWESRLGKSGHFHVTREACADAISRRNPYLEIGDAAACLTLVGLTRHDDVLVVNSGLHHNADPNRTLTSSVTRLATWHRNAVKQQQAPCMLWMETLPQHFDSWDGRYIAPSSSEAPTNVTDKEGLYSQWPSNGNEVDPRCQCRPLDVARDQNGHHQRFNDISSPLISQAGISMIHVYSLLVQRWDLHLGCRMIGNRTRKDCTHYRPEAYESLAAKVLSTVDKTCLWERKLASNSAS